MAYTAADFATFLKAAMPDETFNSDTVLEDMPHRQAVVNQTSGGRTHMEGLLADLLFRVRVRNLPDDKDGARDFAHNVELAVLKADVPYVTAGDDRVVSMSVDRIPAPESGTPDNGRRYVHAATYRVTVNTDL